MSDIDKEIAEFHAAARRRKAVIYGIAAVLLIALGAVVLVVAFLGSEGGELHGRFPVKVIAGGAALVFAGLAAAWAAFRIGTGQVNDVDYDPR